MTQVILKSNIVFIHASKIASFHNEPRRNIVHIYAKSAMGSSTFCNTREKSSVDTRKRKYEGESVKQGPVGIIYLRTERLHRRAERPGLVPILIEILASFDNDQRKEQG
jgi:hypothetical protein